jgi:hypothetical protein
MSGAWLCPYLTTPGREHAAFNGKKPPAGQLARRVEERVEADHRFGRVALSAPRQGELPWGSTGSAPGPGQSRGT